ncbi:CHASE2 domain-containing protein [Dyella japonica]|uniref:CHASE2 domain-containing protein n=1 Tax=Dyella japonica TaxID=231455 RepID=UPI00035C1E9E|nr:CHASE2 domain-containing protein [Dyella japonica]
MLGNALSWLTRAIVFMAAIGLFTVLLINDSTTSFDNSIYDMQARYWGFTPSDDVIIVAIDQKSIDELGQFPWHRSIHARLIDKLTAVDVRGVGMDIIMSTPESGHSRDDLMLADAIRRNGKVVMPVYAEVTRLNGTLQEILPIPLFAKNVAALGHVDVAEDDDALVRGVYLKAGLGGAYWPSIALALKQLDSAEPAIEPPGLRNPQANNASPYLWVRDNYALLRYAGPAGTFGRVSYVDVLNGIVPNTVLRGHWVLIGAAANGFGDTIQTPYSRMPGVEYQANVLESARRGIFVTPLSLLAQWLLSVCMLGVPLLLYEVQMLRTGGRLLTIASLSIVAICFTLLRIRYTWWPPTGCLMTVCLEIPTLMLLLKQRYI